MAELILNLTPWRERYSPRRVQQMRVFLQSYSVVPSKGSESSEDFWESLEDISGALLYGIDPLDEMETSDCCQPQ